MKNKRKRIIIFHFLPIEGYPPVQNFINFIGKDKSLKVYCFTTYGNYQHEFSNETIKIIRFGNSSTTSNGINFNLYLSYLFYNSIGTLRAICISPFSVFYYETLSAFPALCIKFWKSRVKLFIHYHEYMTASEYNSGSFYQRILHSLERKMYKQALWISQTNEQRLDFFLNDHGVKDISNFKIAPNYPPKSWLGKSKEEKRPDRSQILKMVYVGYGLNNSTMYSDEIIAWVLENNEIQLDFYLFKIPDYEKTYLQKLAANHINFYNSVAYVNLPNVLKRYDIGLVLYKATTFNYKYNVPNKFYEYLACHLDVWFPKEMVSPKQYVTHNTYPQVLELNFENLHSFNWKERLRSSSLSFKPFDINYESLYEKIVMSLKADHMK